MAEYSKPTLFNNAKSHHKNGDGTGVETRIVPKSDGSNDYVQSATEFSVLKQDYVTTKRLIERTMVRRNSI